MQTPGRPARTIATVVELDIVTRHPHDAVSRQLKAGLQVLGRMIDPQACPTLPHSRVTEGPRPPSPSTPRRAGARSKPPCDRTGRQVQRLVLQHVDTGIVRVEPGIVVHIDRREYLTIHHTVHY